MITESFTSLIYGFGVLADPMNLLYMFLGVTLGVLIGVLPGLGGANGVAILLPLTFSMEPTGAIIMLSSIAAQTGGVIGPHYAASKAGLIGLTHSYASLLAKEGITCNAIAPALIDTDMIRGNEGIKPDLVPIGRFGTCDEVADVAVLLAGNGYITGQTINVNGGWYMS